MTDIVPVKGNCVNSRAYKWQKLNRDCF